MIDSVINKLKEFALQDFPISEVSSYLLKLKIGTKELEKFNHRTNDSYTRNLIHRDNDFEILVICWPPKTSAPIHGHEGEKCWARVQTGQLKICNFEEVSMQPLKLKQIQKFNCTPGFLDGPADIHSVENNSNEFATSLHIYAKPYDKCDIYDIKNGKVERIKLNYHSINGILC
ncbi:MAG: cysteine dioxygenase [Candidatus Neomarinimicrobiota bacterium]